MNWGKVSVGFAFGAALVVAYIATLKAAPASTGNTSNTPATPATSSSVAVPAFNVLNGVVGNTPVISFPDIGGTSANVTQPV